MKPVDAHCLVDLPGISPQATVETGMVLGLMGGGEWHRSKLEERVSFQEAIV